MVDVKNRRCSQQGCNKVPLYGVDGSNQREFCSEHKKDGMVNVTSRRCGQQGCTKWRYFGGSGSNQPEFCSAHKKDGMVNVVSKRCNSDRRTARTVATTRSSAGNT